MIRFLSALAALALAVGMALPGRADSVSSAYNAFGFRLLNETLREKLAPNLFLSPASLGFALGMVQNGAGGQTLQEMRQMLGVEGVATGQLNRENKELLGGLTGGDTNTALQIANAIWCDNNITIKPAFLAVNQDTFAAKIATGDFRSLATVNAINQWVNDRTHGKISGIVTPPLDPLLRLILLDAIYFKGNWTTPFRKEATHDAAFNLADGTSFSGPRMSRWGEMEYLETDDFQAVRLPYGNGDYRMCVFLPTNGLANFVGPLNAKNWGDWSAGFRRHQGQLELPRFKLENSYDLNDPLKALGMRRAFSREADLSGISHQPLSIGWVKQKTFVDVNEEGTVAAAVTAIGVRASGIARPLESPFSMIVDRPFFVAIEEKKSGLLLFLGAINDLR